LYTRFGGFFGEKKKRNKFSIEDREQAVLKILKEGRSCHSVAQDLKTCQIDWAMG